MIQKIKKLALAISGSALLMLSLVPAVALAQTCSTSTNQQQSCLNTNLCNGSNFNLSGSGNPGDTSACNDANTPSSLSSKIRTLLNILSAVIGVIAVIMIIYAGFRYVSSAGSEGGVKAAKNAIIYAIIGLVVVALAQIIVHFVIANVTG